MIGSGVYALSEKGRHRFDRFPEIIGDDLFVRNLFAPGERRSLDTCSFTIHAPTKFGALVRIKARSRAGQLEYRRRFPERRIVGTTGAAGVRPLLAAPRLWPSLAVFAYVSGRSWLAAWWKAHSGQLDIWERDDTSRRQLGR